MTPLGSFDPRMVDLLTRAGSAPIRLSSATGVKADAYNLIIRLRALRLRMMEEHHILADQAAGVWVRWDDATKQVVIEPRDRGLDDFVEDLADGTKRPLSQGAGIAFSDVIELPGEDPLADPNLGRKDPDAWMRSGVKPSFVYQPIVGAFDARADKAPNEDPIDE